MNEITGQGLQELAAQLEQGIDPYSVIGKLYVRTLAKDQALALAIQALRALVPQVPPDEPQSPTIPVVDNLPPDAPEGAVVAMVVESEPVVAMDSGPVTPGSDFGAMPKKTRRSKRG